MATSQVETVSSGADKVKLILALGLVLVGFVAYFVLSAQAEYVRWSALLVGVAAGCGVFLFSGLGKAFLAFVQDSVKELHKIVWPERREVFQIFLFVLVFVVVMSLFLWLVDKGLEWVFYSLILGWR